MNKTEHMSDVAYLRQQIAEEYKAMKNGLTGLSSGTAKHAFLQSKMQRADRYHSQLAEYVGEHEATHTVCEIYNKIMS